MKINRDRIQQNLAELATFGIDPQGGLTRSIGSESELEARKWLIDKAQALNAAVVTDAIANIWIVTTRSTTNLKPITIGSHHDTVPNGGKYDGALGVLLGLEVMQTIIENKVSLKHPLQVVSFTAEEPNPYNISTMGSRSVTGKLSQEVLNSATDCFTGALLTDSIRKAGGDISNLKEAQLKENDMAAFIECHIEQGSNLYKKNKSVAVVSKITGIYREQITVEGEANHAGTTLMEDRHDALLAAAEACLALEKTIVGVGRNDVAGTVGKFSIFPNAANIIPGKAEFILEIRTPDEQTKALAIAEITTALNGISKQRAVQFNREVILNQAPVNMSPVIREALANSIQNRDEELITLVSMAGHDAVHMTDITNTGMLFVQSIDGKSHCADEETRIEDIEVAGNVLLDTILELDKILE